MNRAQFMEQLERLLADISEAERQEALDYYESYFDDAGEENEADVIRELGSPGKVAAIIKADLKESNERYAQYSETGYSDTRTKDERQMPERRKGYHADRTKRRSVLILILIALIFVSPFIEGAVGGVFGVLVTIVLLPFLIVLTLGAVSIGLIVGGVICGLTGIGICIGSPAAGVLALGVGCILLAAGILLMMLTATIAGKVIPKIIRKFTDFCGRLLHRERKDGAEE